MKTVKAWEALKAWQETRQRCRPVGTICQTNPAFRNPAEWFNFTAYEFILEPPKPQVVELTMEGSCPSKDLLRHDDYKKLLGKRWRCVCTEIMEDT